jgi:hypothetical protein
MMSPRPAAGPDQVNSGPSVGLRRHAAAVTDRQQQHDHADHGGLADAARPEVAHVHAHHHCDGNGGTPHGERAPRDCASALTTTSASTASIMIMIASVPIQRDASAGHRPQFHRDHVAQRAAVAAHRTEQHHEILHRAGDDHADQNPQRARQVAHLRGQHRADQRPAPAMAAKWWPYSTHLSVGHVIEPVVAGVTAGVIRLSSSCKTVLGDEFAVEAVGDEIDA